MPSYFLALGSNLGDREANLRSAVAELRSRGIEVVRSASVYTTEPKEIHDQPWFLNTVVQARTPLEPEALMRACLEIEAALGRERTQLNGPRTIDIDIILAGDRVVRSESVTLPHPRYALRRFVLEPLAEIAPEAVDPIREASAADLLGELADDGIVRRTGEPVA
jgi:2-amino-4-hydroxy-6-hydroxymethyldihydropteridine diphosphokinase